MSGRLSKEGQELYDIEQALEAHMQREMNELRRKGAPRERANESQKPPQKIDIERARRNQTNRSGTSQNRSNNTSNNKPKKKKNVFARILVILLVIVAFFMILGAIIFHNMYKSVNYEESEVITAGLKEDGVTNILIIGNDSREGVSGGRSDAMIVMSISDKTKTVCLTSLLRDIYVDIPGYESNRLNAAYSFGGAELLVKTIEQNFDIPISGYVEVNFNTFVALIDAVDGIDLELTGEEKYWVNAYLGEYNMIMGNEQGTYEIADLSDGMIHLNGPQALAYSRNRYVGSDFGRTERQRKVITQAMKKLPGAVIKHPSTVTQELLPNLTTSFTEWKAYRLSYSIPKLVTYEVKQISIPETGTYSDVYIRDMAVLQIDFEANKKIIRQEIYGEE